MNPNFEFVIPSFIFCLLDILVLRHANREKAHTDKQKVFNIFGIVVLLQQIASTIMTIQQREAASVGFVIMNLSSIMLLCCMTASSQSLIRYTVTLEKDGDQATRGFIILNAIPLTIMIITCFLSPWTHWIFYVDSATGMYVRGNLFILQIILPYSYFFIEMGYILKQKIKGKSISLLYKQFTIFFMPSLVGVVIQLLGYVGGYSSIGISFGMILLYLDLYIDEMNDAKRLAEIEVLNKQLEESNKAKTSFLFNMSHDIRTPMNAIIGFTNMAKKNIDNKEKVVDCLEKTQSASDLLLSLINNVLDMSRIESGKITMNENESDLMLSFVNVIPTMQELAKSKDITLTFNYGDFTDRYVYVDIPRIVRVFANMITNAIKYTNEGGHVDVSLEQIGKEGNKGIYKFSFKDDGIGMSPEFQKQVFEPFARENSSTVSGIQGTGLGLAICKTFIETMGGTITCESEQGVGTTFDIILPLKLQENQQKYTDPISGQVKDSVEGMEQQVSSFAGRKVLLVEDNELNMEIAVDILEEQGMEVETAEDGQIAVDILKEKGPTYYDFILMDIQMPNMNGYEATKEIRVMYPTANIPIIALSANAFSEDKAASIKAGMNDHVAKPINIDELNKALNRFI